MYILIIARFNNLKQTLHYIIFILHIHLFLDEIKDFVQADDTYFQFVNC